MGVESFELAKHDTIENFFDASAKSHNIIKNTINSLVNPIHVILREKIRSLPLYR